MTTLYNVEPQTIAKLVYNGFIIPIVIVMILTKKFKTLVFEVSTGKKRNCKTVGS